MVLTGAVGSSFSMAVSGSSSGSSFLRDSAASLFAIERWSSSDIMLAIYSKGCKRMLITGYELGSVWEWEFSLPSSKGSLWLLDILDN